MSAIGWLFLGMPVASSQRSALELASSQFGVVARRQLAARGVGRGVIGDWLLKGRLFTVFRGVYAIGRPVDSFRAIWMASVLRGGPDSALAGVSAAAVWGLMKPGQRIYVVRPRAKARVFDGHGHHSRFACVTRMASLGHEDVTAVRGVPTLSVPRTLIDLAGILDDRLLRRAFVEAGRIGFLTEEALDRLALGGSYPGRSRLLALASTWSPGTGLVRSALEAEFLLLCGRHGVPVPRTNRRVQGYEVDCLWTRSKLIVELDGRRFHDDGFGWEADLAKSNALIAAGYKVLRFTYRAVMEADQDVARAVLRELEPG